MKKLVMMLLVLVAVGGTTEVSAQAWLKKLGKKVENAAKNAVERNAERKTEKAVDDLFDGKVGKGNKNNNGNNNADEVYDNGNGDATAQSGQQKPQSVEMAYAKSDFVAGDEIIFDDPMDNEQLGEWPSMWDLYNGNGETMSVGGKKAMMISERWTKVGPLMKTPKNYLGDMFTIEFDYFYDVTGEWTSTWLVLNFYMADTQGNDRDKLMHFAKAVSGGERQDGRWNSEWQTNNGESRGEGNVELLENQWNHFAISFNKRAWKVYVNGVRIINVPNVKTPPGWFEFEVSNGNKNIYLTNLRIAKGAVPLYDRMMSEGKFITYGITFDVGKSTIKPESMGEINRIVQLMTENPDLKFSVEGHTDSTGNAASNQTLSEARSQAIVAKLVELGIASDRLTAVGKGQNSPIADNNTDEGRAKNRRVEFVKM